MLDPKTVIPGDVLRHTVTHRLYTLVRIAGNKAYVLSRSHSNMSRRTGNAESNGEPLGTAIPLLFLEEAEAAEEEVA